jgi:tetratricopeptide (TPR) repeat protein
MFYFARHHDKAIEQLLKTIDLNADFASAHAILGWAYAERGLHKQAIAACERALALDDAPWILASFGYALAGAGRKGAAEHVLDLMKERASHAYVSPYDLAIMYAILGKLEQALAHLEGAYEERSGVLVWGLQHDPRLDGLRGDTRFAQLLRRLGFASEDDAKPPQATDRLA